MMYCVCQSKNGRTGMCDVIPKYQDELLLYKKALKLACVDLIWELGHPSRMDTEIPEYMNNYLQKACDI